ncbi:hypothetical protein MBANPS3_007206 [Mucor bainieri]
MNSSPSKTEARKDQYMGDAKQTVGSAVGNDHLQAQGQAQNNNETTANAANLVTGVVNGATGTVQGVLGGLLGGNNNNR